MTLKLPATKAALAVWTEGQQERADAWQAAMTNGAVYKCEANDWDALALLHTAYFEDTKHLNGMSAIQCMTVADIQKMVWGIDP